MSNNKFPWNCGDCPMLKTYDMSIDDLTHVCLWNKKQIDDCDRYKSAECPLEKHDSELLDKVADRIHKKMCFENCGERQCVDSMDRCVWYGYVTEVIAEMKSEIEE